MDQDLGQRATELYSLASPRHSHLAATTPPESPQQLGIMRCLAKGYTDSADVRRVKGLLLPRLGFDDGTNVG